MDYLKPPVRQLLPALCLLCLTLVGNAQASECSVISKSEFTNGKTCAGAALAQNQQQLFQQAENKQHSSLNLKFRSPKEKTLDRYMDHYLDRSMGQLSSLVKPLEDGVEGKKLFLDVDGDSAELKWQWNF